MRQGVVLALLLTACRHGYGPEKPVPRAGSQVHYDEAVAVAHAEMRERMIALECSDGRTYRDRCGLVWSDVTRPKKLGKFISKVCGLDPDTTVELPDECRLSFWGMYASRLAERYDALPIERVMLHLDAHPTDEPEKIERWILKRHNEALVDEYEERENQARVESRAIARTEPRRLSRNEEAKIALRRFFAGMAADRICRTMGDGPDAVTACWSK